MPPHLLPPQHSRIKDWSYVVPEFAYACFCMNCRRRIASHPLENCPFPQHMAQFERARAMKRSPPKRLKSKNGEGLYIRIGRYERTVCRSCRKGLNCSPAQNCSLEGHRIYYEKNLEKLRMKHWEAKAQVIRLLGGKCVSCGVTDIRILQVNHKTRESHVPWDKRSATKFFKWIVKGKLPLGSYDLRCANCNILFEYDSGHRSIPEKFASRK